jgi:pentatricopeptide repeat protein
MSRAACQAVRLSIQNGALGDAYYVVNSLWNSTLRGTTDASEKPRCLRQSRQNFESVTINFGREVSPRLSSHALLHGLVRIGLTKKAYKLAELMMESGIRLRSRTLEAVILRLAPDSSASTGTSGGIIRALRTMLNRPDILMLRPSMLDDEGTRYALKLLLEARNSRHRRTEGMYNALISACLFNGEIIVASLIFGLVVKDWQLRKSLTARVNTVTQSEVDEQLVNDKARYDHLRSESVFPSRSSMYSMLSSIDATMVQGGEGETFRWTFRAALQALANLAMLLDNRQIPFPEIAPLIRALYNCPRVEDEIWIFDKKGRPKQIRAYPYFHGVLKRLIGSLPARRPPRIIMNPEIASTLPSLDLKRYEDMLPPLDLPGYNNLLHYALRQRFSPGLANKILNHMSKERYKTLEPDIVTFNILIRSGTLLRSLDITEQALQMLRRRKENANHGIMVPAEEVKPIHRLSTMSDTAPSSRFSKSLHRVDQETLEVPTHSTSNTYPGTQLAPLVADSFTLSSYITHLTSTGQPQVVADLLFRVLPELTIVDHPSWGILTLEERKKMRIKSRRACLKRAVSYGPHFFASVLNALFKAGKTGLTERVWLLAKQAERASWITDFVPGIQPWCLPVHAYTTMIQCYGMEARKGAVVLRAARHIHANDPYPWVPRSKQYVVGWANFVLERNRMMERGRIRRSMGRSMGALLYRSMRSGALAVYEALKEIQKQKKVQWKPAQIPKPDSRFFNAALYLFASQPHMRPRRARFGPAHWNRHLRFTSAWYAQSGVIPSHWTLLLQEVAEDMVEAGYAIPPGLRHLFVGQLAQGTLQYDNPRQIERRPFAFPPPRKYFLSHSIPTHKSRGLPLGRRRLRGLGRPGTCKTNYNMC